MNEPSLAPFLVADIGGIVLLPFFLAGIAFWVWMLVDCANYEKEGSTKIAWLLIILLVGIIGAPLYFFTRRLPRQRLAHYHVTNRLIRPWSGRNIIEQSVGGESNRS